VPIQLTCKCGHEFRVGDEFLGREVGCPACGQALVVSKGPDPYFGEGGVPQTSGKAIGSLVLGILSFFCFFFTGLPAIILGAMGLSDIGRSGGRLVGRGMAIAGIVLGAFGCVFMSFAVLMALLLPAVQAAREAARRAQCVNNLKQIGLAMHNFASSEGHFPAPAITDPQGKPLLSWRVAILPYIEQESLYRQFKLDEPWDSPNNLPLLSQMPSVYLCPTDGPNADFKTRYQGISGQGAMFDPTKATTIGNITDGTSNTLLVAESAQPVPWTKPEDIDLAGITTSLGSLHPGGMNVIFADGSVRFIKTSINPATLQALGTKAGGEVVSPAGY
jgi:prepilin-type processing-associated H-X9-DG protein